MTADRSSPPPVRSLPLRPLLLITALISGLCFLVLIGMGQPAWCACGQWTPWSWNIWSSHNSQHLLDPYTLTHVLHGVVFCGLLWFLPQTVGPAPRYLMAIGLEAIWEILENTPQMIERYRQATISLDYFGDSAANSAVDILACALGYLLALQLGFKRSVLLFVIAELILLVTIRDGLTLNVIMLVWPVDAIKHWQMALAP